MLNAAQELAVRAPGNCLITACPGSGKTTVLTHRGEYLLKNNPGTRLLGVTFTAEAAKELGNRIAARVPDARTRVLCGTFHSLCKRQIEKSGRRVKVVDEAAQAELLRLAYGDALQPGDSLPFDACVTFIETVKAELNPLMPNRLDQRVRVYEAYQKRLGQIGAFDFADLLLLATRGMADGSIKPFAVDYILADEYQDSDPVQSRWLIEHLRAGSQICVVGDDDQSIYGWRFSQGYKALENFKRDAKATHVSLNMTYRCAPSIMAASARLIVNNAERIQKNLQTNVTREAGDIKVVRFGNREDEFKACETAIIQSGRPGDWGVLARTNKILSDFEQAAKIAVHRIGGVSFWDVRGPALFLGLCRSMATGEMDGVDQVLRRSGLNDAQIDELHQRCRSHEPGALRRFLAEADPPKSTSPLAHLRERMRGWMRMLAAKNDRDTDLVIVGVGYHITGQVQVYSDKRDRDQMQLDANRINSAAQTLQTLRGPLRTRLMYLENRDASENRKNQPKLMTLHSAKGLEFPFVWILGCEEGCLPAATSPIDEERRLMYVGMTRAKSILRMSFASEKNPPSRFLAEAGVN
jgi:superfamily I DNA/RNA helicase